MGHEFLSSDRKNYSIRVNLGEGRFYFRPESLHTGGHG